jgi:hypothetical protein
VSGLREAQPIRRFPKIARVLQGCGTTRPNLELYVCAVYRGFIVKKLDFLRVDILRVVILDLMTHTHTHKTQNIPFKSVYDRIFADFISLLACRLE